MSECKKCDYRFKFEPTEDGLCEMCHMGTCKDKDCERCFDNVTKLIKWVKSKDALKE